MYVENCLYCTLHRISDWALCLKIELGVKGAFLFFICFGEERENELFPTKDI